MLKCVNHSQATKLGGIAATYRSGGASRYSTCPQTCPFMPEEARGTPEVDREYLAALLDAVPRGGVSFTFSHFHYTQLPKPTPRKTVVNVSTETVGDALSAHRAGYPTVYAAPLDEDAKMDVHDGVRFIRCPEQYNPRVNCSNCGGAKGPLCARPKRDYVIKFVAHGTKAANLGAGACYGIYGPTGWQWNRTMQQEQTESDAARLRAFAKSLPYGTVLRHHVVGDVGRE